jgi:hypothetical protein
MSNGEGRGNSGDPPKGWGNNCKYIFPGLHSCLTAQNPTGSPHTMAYVMDVNTTEISTSLPTRNEMSAAKAIELYMSQSASSASVRRTCVCCAAAFKVSLDDITPYDVPHMPHCSALICTTCTSSPQLDNDDQNFFVCSECTRLSQEALAEAKMCVGGAFGISRAIHLKDIIAFHLFLQRIDASIARAFLVFPAQVGFNTTIYQGTTASVDYVEALSIFNRARHADIRVRPTTSTTVAIIYTAFHTFFVTQKCLNIAIAARASIDSAVAASKAAKTASKALLPLTSSLPPAAAVREAELQERKRKRDESNYTCRGLDMEIRLGEAHRLNMTLAIEQIRAVLRSRD